MKNNIAFLSNDRDDRMFFNMIANFLPEEWNDKENNRIWIFDDENFEMRIKKEKWKRENINIIIVCFEDHKKEYSIQRKTIRVKRTILPLVFFEENISIFMK